MKYFEYVIEDLFKFNGTKKIQSSMLRILMNELFDRIYLKI